VTVAAEGRAATLARLESDRFDLLVVGGGIVGSRVALEASLAGLRVALVDGGDFAGATSSASSKLIHGGFRYLSLGNLGLVRRAQWERRPLVERVAPHLIHPMPLVLSIDGESPHSWPAIAFGLALYAGLSGFRSPSGRMITRGEACARVPVLRTDGVRACAVLDEAQTNDSRLTLATVAAAARAGAAVANYVVVDALEWGAGRVRALAHSRLGEGDLSLEARAVVNATGPWVDVVRRLETPHAGTAVRLSKGVHVMLPLPGGRWRAGAATLLGDKRAVYAVPCEGLLMLGATDTAFDGDPGSVAVEPADVATLLGQARRLLPDELLRREEIRFAYAGLRVLPVGAGDTARAPREHVVSVGPRGMISVAGGKLTTHRRIAIDVLRRLPAEIAPARLAPSDLPIAGGAAGRNGAGPDAAPNGDPRAHLARVYGSDAGAVVAYAETVPDALEPIHPDGPDVWAQVHHAVEHEWALTVEDVVRRRTTLGLRGLSGLAAAPVERRLEALVGRAHQERFHDARVGEPSGLKPP
jgi:glycerol-3-phosphate dehydrogenase